MKFATLHECEGWMREKRRNLPGLLRHYPALRGNVLYIACDSLSTEIVSSSVRCSLSAASAMLCEVLTAGRSLMYHLKSLLIQQQADCNAWRSVTCRHSQSNAVTVHDLVHNCSPTLGLYSVGLEDVMLCGDSCCACNPA